MIATITIPAALIARPQWVGWRKELRRDKWTKVPYQVLAPATPASSTDPATWASYDAAVAARGKFDGIGYVLRKTDDVVFIDLDHCVDPDTTEIDPWALAYIEEFDSFAEYSQSSAGIHILAGGIFDGTGKHRDDSNGNPVEMYRDARFIAITGDKVPGMPVTIEPRQAAIDALYEQLGGAGGDRPQEQHDPLPLSVTDEEIVAKAMSNSVWGVEFQRLYAGDLSDISDANPSAGDWRMLRQLYFQTRGDRDRMRRIMLNSGLVRDKWNDRRGDKTYLDYNIDAAIARGGNVYDPKFGHIELILPSKNGYRRNGDGAGGGGDDGGHADDAGGPRSLPLLNAGDGSLPRITAQAWDAVAAANDPPVLFVQGNRAIRIDPRDDDVVVQDLTPERLRYHTAAAATWYRDHKKKDETRRLPAAPPKDVVTNQLASPVYPLPELTRIVSAPVFSRAAKLVTEPGYDAAAKVFLHGCVAVDVPPRPTAADVEAAKQIIFGDLLYDFPLVGDASRAHALALMLQPIVRDLINGPTPLYLIDKPMAGTGAGLLADVLTYPFMGKRLSVMSMARDEENTNKRLTAKLCEAPAAVLIDNLPPNRRVESESLAAMLTCEVWTDRVLGKNTVTITVPNRTTWIATGNNPRLSDELARRGVNIHIDAKTDRPDQRKGWKHPNLRTWVTVHREEVLTAALTICQAWVSNGRPLYVGTRRGSYEAWCDVMGGILQTAGIAGFLSNDDDMYARANDELELWRGFVNVWWDKFAGAGVGVGELYPLVTDPESDVAFELGKGSERSQRVRFGNLIKSKRDNVIGSHQITYAGDVKRAARWKLEPVNVGESR